jgi:ketosteroid isomerase-like protein
MSQDDVEVVERLLTEFIAIGPDAVPPDFIFDMSTMRGWPDQPLFHGVEGMTEFMGAWREPYDDWSMEVEQVRDAGGGRVVALCVQRGRLRGSESDVGLRFGVVYTVENRRVRRGEVYMTVEESLEAAGLG